MFKRLSKIAFFKVKLNWTRGSFLFFHSKVTGQRYNNLKTNSYGKLALIQVYSVRERGRERVWRGQNKMV